MLGGWRRWRCWWGRRTRVESRGLRCDEVSGIGSQVSGVGLRLPRLNENQLAVMAELAAVGGRMRVRDLRAEFAVGCRSLRWGRW